MGRKNITQIYFYGKLFQMPNGRKSDSKINEELDLNSKK